MFHSRFSHLFIFAVFINLFISQNSALSQSVDLGPLSIGNSINHDGIRLNFRDSGVESVNGINVTIWKSRGQNTSKIRGLAIGLPYASAGTLNGTAIGILSVVAEQEANGVVLSGLVNVIGESGDAFMLSGLLNVIGESGKGFMAASLMNITGNSHKGVQVAGLGNISGESKKGVQIGGIMNVVGNDMDGAQFSTLMNINGEHAKGIRAAGLMNITGESSKGFALAGLMNVSGKQMKGFSAAGIMNVSEQISGFSFATANVAVNLDGIHLAALNLTDPNSGDLSGIALAPFNVVRNNQSGITIGLFNFAKRMNRNGLQIGLFNVIKSNPKGLRFLPLFNKNFK